VAIVRDRANPWAVQYDWSADELRKQWAAFQARAVDVGRPDFEPWRTYEPPRWWRAEVDDVRVRPSVDFGPQTVATLRDADIRRLHAALDELRRVDADSRTDVSRS
jgi:hypothetical protein